MVAVVVVVVVGVGVGVGVVVVVVDETSLRIVWRQRVAGELRRLRGHACHPARQWRCQWPVRRRLLLLLLLLLLLRHSPACLSAVCMRT